MAMAVIFGMNQILSHGFGVFLFAALVPLMRESIAISNWHLATIGAACQLAYLAGALLLSLLAHRIAASRLLLATGGLTVASLTAMAFVESSLIITVVLVLMSACAAVSWGAIVDITTRSIDPRKASTCLSTAASGTAWGYGINGLLLLLLVPILGWQSAWFFAAGLGAVVIVTTWRMLSGFKPAGDTNDVGADTAMAASELLRAVSTQPVALCAVLICFFVGFTTMPFTTWLNTFLVELELPSSLGGLTWTALGLSGMAAGFISGKLADLKGHGTAMLLIFCSFVLGLCLFVYDPARFALAAGVGYGLMYFPVWGIIAGWVGRHFSATATTQISSLCMVMAGAGGAAGNLLAGAIADSTGSLLLLYQVLASAAVLPAILALWICRRYPLSRDAAELTDSGATV